MVLVSVAMATYNGEKYIHQQIDSILAQSYQNFEIIIHDDCSNDQTVAIIQEYIKKDRRIKFKRNDANLGFAKNFESIIAECNGEYIAFCDQDDIWTEDHLEVLFELIKDNNVSCGNAILIDENGSFLGFTMQNVTGMSENIPKERLKYRLFYDNFAQGTAMMARRDFCMKYLPVPHEIKYHDYWLALIASLSNSVVYTNKIVLNYRQHGNNVTSNIKNSLLRELYNSINGFNRKHSEIQVQRLKAIERRFHENQDVKDAINFYSSHLRKENKCFQQEYFLEHQQEMFPNDKYRFLRKILYL